MPTVARVGEFTFVVHTKELPFEPPHVHVSFGDDEVRIELLGGTFMEEPAEPKRRAILEAFQANMEVIWTAWNAYHGDTDAEHD